MARWICKIIPSLCPRNVIGPKGGPGMDLPEDLPLWLQDWLHRINDAEEPPTAEDLVTLANAFLAANHPELTHELAMHDHEITIDFGAAPQAKLWLIDQQAQSIIKGVDPIDQLLQTAPALRDWIKTAKPIAEPAPIEARPAEVQNVTH